MLPIPAFREKAIIFDMDRLAFMDRFALLLERVRAVAAMRVGIDRAGDNGGELRGSWGRIIFICGGSWVGRGMRSAALRE